MIFSICKTDFVFVSVCLGIYIKSWQEIGSMQILLPSSQTSGQAAPGFPGDAALLAELALAHVQLSPAKPSSSLCHSESYLQTK